MYRIHSNVHFIELNRSKDSEELDLPKLEYESFATVGEIRVYRRADFQSGSRVLKKVF